MNLKRIHPYVSDQFASIRECFDPVFSSLEAKALSHGRSVNAAVFTGKLNDVLAKHKVTINVHQDKESEFHYDCPIVGGSCDSDGKFPAIDIDVFSFKAGRIKLSESGWQLFRYKIFETLTHELVHRAQAVIGKNNEGLQFRPSRTASGELLEDQQYHGTMCEIEAYARDFIEYWNYTRPGLALTRTRLNQEFKYESDVHAIQYYFDTYEGNKAHPAVKRLFRKIMEWNDIVTPLAHSLPPYPLRVTFSRPLRFTTT